MKLATQCPFCQTTFRVAPEQLTLRGGLVRCGHCKEVFDGNQYLVAPDLPISPPDTQQILQPTITPEGLPSAPSAPSSLAPETNAPAEVPPWMAASLADTFASVAAATSDAPWGAPEETTSPVPLPLPQTAAANQEADGVEPISISPDQSSGANKDEVLSPRTAEAEADTLAATSDMAVVEYVAIPVATKETDVEHSDVPSGEEDKETHQEVHKEIHKEARQIVEVEAEEEDREEQVDEDEDAEPPGFVRRAERQARLARIARIGMAIGTVLLVIALLLQGVYLGRNQLAVWLPATRAPLSAMCERLHCRIGLPSSIGQLSLESSELQLIPPNQNIYSLNLLLRNRSTSAETWPYIELTINDADDKPITRRIFLPKEYLGSPQQVSDGFAAESEQPVKLTFELAQSTAAGYRVYLFFP
ncbi:putative Zn finger-like uncharacterized protein [Herbaspirillum sp. Sphag1AN]|uniref:DUF3426 domain-containing protein n=1 Tax=unclassified Herbaspirillum TaxID=2624150 RepID=UPI00160A1D7E|nr:MULTISPECIES: DUF3426 domain-containing protein [unclassified Herbaspirillum]MBB3213774.1 putative Zn finger-like uncharacterized protein [Herbaspirillum sp. Sphag1AN]MBB3246971.1 putative Zn finger-like uncharacterized protein [Herbaspirillum sp. Sphag64]